MLHAAWGKRTEHCSSGFGRDAGVRARQEHAHSRAAPEAEPYRCLMKLRLRLGSRVREEWTRGLETERARCGAHPVGRPGVRCGDRCADLHECLDLAPLQLGTVALLHCASYSSTRPLEEGWALLALLPPPSSFLIFLFLGCHDLLLFFSWAPSSCCLLPR